MVGCQLACNAICSHPTNQNQSRRASGSVRKASFSEPITVTNQIESNQISKGRSSNQILLLGFNLPGLILIETSATLIQCDDHTLPEGFEVLWIANFYIFSAPRHWSSVHPHYVANS